jgi:hypothetical protein
MTNSGGDKMRFKAEYIGGHPLYTKKMKVELVVDSNELRIPEMNLTIPYNKLTNVQKMTQEKISALRLFLVGIFALAWKKKKEFLVISYRDDAEIEHSMVFDTKEIDNVTPLLYQKMIEARQF